MELLVQNVHLVRKAPLAAFISFLMDIALIFLIGLVGVRVVPAILEILKNANEMIAPALNYINVESVSASYIPKLASTQIEIEAYLHQATLLFIVLLIFAYVCWSIFGGLGWYLLGGHPEKASIITYLGRVMAVNVGWFVLLVGLLFGYATSVLYVPFFKEIWSFTFFFLMLCILYFVPLHHAYLLKHRITKATMLVFHTGVLRTLKVFTNYFLVCLIAACGIFVVMLLGMIHAALMPPAFIILFMPMFVLLRLQVLSFINQLSEKQDSDTG